LRHNSPSFLNCVTHQLTQENRTMLFADRRDGRPL
jgi:hypothetical protein